MRRLAAILAADVVGYSALMGSDERRTLAALRSLRLDVLEPAVAWHRGTVAKSMGDGWLIVFAAAADAAACALQIQDRLAEAGALRLRIGIHVGDVTQDGDDIFGDGVNLAARLEAFAPTGGIAVSEAVFNGLDGPRRAQFAEVGPQRFKNIDREITVWVHGSMDTQAIAPRNVPNPTSVTIAPFAAMGNDVGLAMLAEGLSDDLGTELARFRWLHVTGAGPARYRVRGTVRGGAGRVRVHVSLEHIEDGRRVWAERWDRSGDDLLAVQDDLLTELIALITAEIDTHAKVILRARLDETLSAAELIARANDLIGDPRPDNQRRAVSLIDRAVALEPESAQVHTQTAFVLWHQAVSGLAPFKATAHAALGHARRAIELDRSWASAYAMAGAILGVLGETDRALEAADRTAAINPNAWGAPHGRALALAFARPDYAADPLAIIAHAEETLRLAPRSAFNARHLCFLGFGILLRDAGGPYDDALATLDTAAAEPGTNWWPGLFIALILLREGREEAARPRLDALRLAFPHLRLSAYRDLFGPTRLGRDWAPEAGRLPPLGLS